MSAQEKVTPKVFISYSWTTLQHQEMVKEWADRLLSDGVDVILDIYDLKEGHDKNAFMEKMVADHEVTNVLIICDKGYAEKADAREKGVGTETQIISQEVYEKVEQSKFIPIVTQFRENEKPYLPTFLKSRIWMDFSSLEAVNSNWERLVRILYGKPVHEKPKRGGAPAFLAEGEMPISPARAKFQLFKQAILAGKPGVALYRKDFLDACIEFADKLRVRQRPEVEILGEKVMEDCGKLVAVRDHIVDWILVEGSASQSEAFSEALIEFLERLRELKARPPEVNEWNDAWFEAHKIFVFETFLYIIASLLKVGAYGVLNDIYTSHYIMPATERYGDERFERFDQFYGYSETLQGVMAPEGRRYLSAAAELLKRQANRADIPFAELMQADLLTLLIAFITPDTRWYPQLMHCSRFVNEFPFFIRASQRKNYKKLERITGIESVEVLREKVKAGHERLDVRRWHDFHRSFWNAMNMDNLDTIK